MLKEVWCEGDPLRDYTACHLGYGKGETLAEACADLAAKSEHFKSFYNQKTMKYKGCRLFLDESEARDSYN